jgi:hypothetical protein
MVQAIRGVLFVLDEYIELDEKGEISSQTSISTPESPIRGIHDTKYSESTPKLLRSYVSNLVVESSGGKNSGQALPEAIDQYNNAVVPLLNSVDNSIECLLGSTDNEYFDDSPLVEMVQNLDISYQVEGQSYLGRPDGYQDSSEEGKERDNVETEQEDIDQPLATGEGEYFILELVGMRHVQRDSAKIAAGDGLNGVLVAFEIENKAASTLEWRGYDHLEFIDEDGFSHQAEQYLSDYCLPNSWRTGKIKITPGTIVKYLTYFEAAKSVPVREIILNRGNHTIGTRGKDFELFEEDEWIKIDLYQNPEFPIDYLPRGIAKEI